MAMTHASVLLLGGLEQINVLQWQVDDDIIGAFWTVASLSAHLMALLL